MMLMFRSLAEPIRADLTSAGDQSRWSWRRSAAAPETCGAAIEVPLIVVFPPPRAVELMLLPGAVSSGLMSSSARSGPREDVAEMPSLLSVLPTVRARGEVPGVLMV